MAEDRDKEPDNYAAMSKEELVAQLETRDSKLKQYSSMQKSTWKQVNSILASIPLGLAILDEVGNIEATNLQLRQMLGAEARDLFGKSIRTIIPELDIEKLDSSSGTSAPHRNKALTTEGKSFSVELSVNEIFKDGKKLFLHIKDISEAEKLLEYKMSLVSMISHDLRTPLTTMRSVLTTVQDGLYGALNEDGSQAVNWALVSSDHMNSILANVLDVEKLDSVGLVPDKTETSSGKIVNEAVSLCRLYAEEAEVELTANTESSLFHADEAKMIRILVNLITNAVKFSPPGGKVQVESHLNGIEIEFKVKDQGPGIAEEMQEAIFNRFQQAGLSKRRGKAGFGLGLAISKAFAEMHGGRLWVESDGKHGSVFVLRIPL
ncbi:MAG: PAS domain-containing sensor histidine kinase [Candidatus Obscuribacterales bacterium]|nr:PAS domain-containing sensor histidine kinase [Candidatus Obscuribacterales bacterium]